jgi:hypothetical protein
MLVPEITNNLGDAMYGRVLGAATTTVTTAGVLTLPNTGGNLIVNVAISVAAGMGVWGVLYARSR